MRPLCFGGSFNPVHHGHLICARAVAEAAGFDRIVLIPSAQPPHKPESADLATARDRAEMCRLAASYDTLFDVSPIELDRAGPSYTLETVRALGEAGWGRVSWLIGADMVAFLPRWHQPQALLREVDFVVMARPGWQFDWDGLPPEYRVLQHSVVQAPLIDISATDIRNRVRQGRSIRYLTPPTVCDYIETRGLYRVS